MSTPQQHRPPVYACAAGAVLHAHSADTLEPAVVLYTFLPSGAGDWLDALDAKIDVHNDGPGSSTLTVRVLSEGQSLAWQLPIAPFVAALPGQPGDDGRMVLLAVMDAEPEQGFWAQPVDCERLSAELQIPVTYLADALRGRLTPWLADDVDLLLHDDAHEHAADLSPAQTLANAVLAHYRGDLEAEESSTRLVRAFEFASKSFAAELGARLCVALSTAIVVAGPEAVDRVLQQANLFEPEVARLLTELPSRLRPDDPLADDPDTTADVLLAGPDHGEALKAGVVAVARLGREAYGPSLNAETLMRNLAMVDDRGQVRLAALWVDLAVAAAGNSDADHVVAAELGKRVESEGSPAGAWLRATTATLASHALRLSGRSAARIATPVQALDDYLANRPRAGQATLAEEATAAIEHCLTLARFVRTRGGIGPRDYLQAPLPSAIRAVAVALSRGLDRAIAVDLLEQLLADDVEAVDALEAFVCATAQLLVEIDPHESEDIVSERLTAALAAVQAGGRSARWLLVGCLREAPEHDPAAADLRPLLEREPVVDLDRQADKLGLPGLLRAGLEALDAATHLIGDSLEMPREDVLAFVLPAALMEHDLLDTPQEDVS